MLNIILSLVLGAGLDSLYYYLYISKIKDIKENKLLLYFGIFIIYIMTNMINQYNLKLYLLFDILIYLLLKFKYKGKTKTLSQWSKKYNINIVTLSDRLKAGLSIDEALNKPVIKSGGKILYTLNGETKLLSEWCQIYNINYQTAWKKSKKGYNIEKILKIEK